MATVSPDVRSADEVRADYLVQLGDDALILGQRLSEWCGHAPVLEVDLSLANLALDLIGQATHLLGAAGDADRLAFHRDVLDFRNCLLVEQPNGDFARTIARQLLYSTWQHLLLQRLTGSSDRFLAEFSAKAVKDERPPHPRIGGFAVNAGAATVPTSIQGGSPYARAPALAPRRAAKPGAAR